MDKLLAQYLDKMLDLEESGLLEEALALSEELLEAFPEKRTEVLLEKAKLEFRNQMDKKALFDFITVYAITKDDTLYELILEAYYAQNEKALRENYLNNLRYLEEYPHFRGIKAEGIVLLPIWQDDELVVCADNINKCFSIYVRYRKENVGGKDKAVMTVNELWIEDLWKIEESFRMSSPFLDMNLPVYAVYDNKYWQLFICLYNIKDLLDKNRIVFLVGEQSVYEYFRGDMG